MGVEGGRGPYATSAASSSAEGWNPPSAGIGRIGPGRDPKRTMPTLAMAVAPPAAIVDGVVVGDQRPEHRGGDPWLAERQETQAIFLIFFCGKTKFRLG